MIKPYLFIKLTSKKGRGLFTTRNIAADVVIEESPVIVMSADERTLLDKTLLHDYIFEWRAEGDTSENTGCCVALGYISVYNHSYTSNCEYFMDFDNEMIQVRTVRKILEGEEVTINYNGDWNNEKKVWFDVE
ncbi:MAG: SET domain-containing protein-lysine N-methyltransferase [Ginsengibacter sp.]